MSDCKIDEIAPHTIHKINLVKAYVEEWAQKLLNNSYCNHLFFIDCMCNCGEYKDKHNAGNIIKGTPYYVAKYLREISQDYPSKKIYAVFNDLDTKKIDHLTNLFTQEGIADTNNFKCCIRNKDASLLLKDISKSILNHSDVHYLIFYDPYQAKINWEPLVPFFNKWGELIMNHMISDTIRTMSVAKSANAIGKLKSTYLTDFSSLVPCGNDRAAYEKLFEKIIRSFRYIDRKYYVSFFPFFNSKNALVYDLVHCTSNIEGFKLYKKCAWKVFGGQSSGKTSKFAPNQMALNFNMDGIIHDVDDNCYTLNNIVDFIIKEYSDRGDVSKDEIWELLDYHPVFPSDGFKKEIASLLKKRGCIIKQSSIIFKRNSK